MELDIASKNLIKNEQLKYVEGLESQMQRYVDNVKRVGERRIQGIVYNLLASGYEIYDVTNILSLIVDVRG